MDSPSVIGAGSAQQPRESSITRPAPPSLHAEVAERLRMVCAHLAPDDFDALVAKIAAFKHRWSEAAMDARARPHWADREVKKPAPAPE